MSGRGSDRGVRILVGLLALQGLAARTASAQQWHELYADGVAALRHGEAREAVHRLVLRLLSKEPADRPTAEELLNELADFLGTAR